MATLTNDSVVLKFYNKYEHLAANYAKQIFEYHKLGFEYEDLLQEFKIKVYTSIIAYSEKWKRWQVTKRYKPVPFELYLKCALNNRVKDFIKTISSLPSHTISIEGLNFDYAQTTSLESRLVVDKKGCMLEINGLNVVSNLPSKAQQQCFILFLKGHPLRKLQKMFKAHNFDAEVLVAEQVEYLQQYKPQLTENITNIYFHYSIEQEIS